MTSPFWPGTNVIKSQQNAFSQHLDDSRAPIQFKAKSGPKPVLTQRRFVVFSKVQPKETL